MTPEQLDKAYTNTIKDLQNNQIMASIGATGLMLLRERVQTTGTDAKGNKYSAYSTKPTLAGRSGMTISAYSKIAGSKEKRKELKWVTVNGHKLFELKQGYKQYRELHGRQTGYVDFMFSGRMWHNINLISSAADHQKGIAIIGAKEDKEKRKLEGNTKRKGDILDLSKNEINELMTQYNLSVLNVFKENGL